MRQPVITSDYALMPSLLATMMSPVGWAADNTLDLSTRASGPANKFLLVVSHIQTLHSQLDRIQVSLGQINKKSVGEGSRLHLHSRLTCIV